MPSFPPSFNGLMWRQQLLDRVAEKQRNEIAKNGAGALQYMGGNLAGTGSFADDWMAYGEALNEAGVKNLRAAPGSFMDPKSGDEGYGRMARTADTPWKLPASLRALGQ